MILNDSHGVIYTPLCCLAVVVSQLTANLATLASVAMVTGKTVQRQDEQRKQMDPD